MLANHSKLLAASAITLLLILVYGARLTNDFVLWDDDFLILENPIIRGLTFGNIGKAFTSYDPELYIPLTFLTYQLNYTLAGLHSWIYHFTNLLLHVFSALLVVAIAERLTKSRWAALVAGLIFAVHPLHTEAVLWASARKDVLAATFGLLSTWYFIRFRDEDRKHYYWLSVALFLTALLSKVNVITLPLVLILIDWWRNVALKKRWIDHMPFLLLSVVFGIVALYGKSEAVEHSSLGETLLMGIKATMFYLGKLLWPMHLAPLYPFHGDIHLSQPALFLPLLAFLALAAVALWSLSKTRSVFAAFLSFFLLILPSFGNFRRGEGGDVYIGSDRYAYMGSIAIILLFAYGALRLRDRYSRTLVDAVLGVLVLGLASVSFFQGRIWQNSETLFRATIVRQPQAEVAYHNLGSVYHTQGKLQEALDLYREAIAITPKASTYANAGDIFREQKMFPEAMTLYNRALDINPESLDGHLGIGLIALAQGNASSALVSFERAVEGSPESPQAHLNLGAAYMGLQRPEDALKAYTRALELQPWSTSALFNIGSAYERMGRLEEAQRYYKAVLELDPGHTAAKAAITPS